MAVNSQNGNNQEIINNMEPNPHQPSPLALLPNLSSEERSSTTHLTLAKVQHALRRQQEQKKFMDFMKAQARALEISAQNQLNKFFAQKNAQVKQLKNTIKQLKTEISLLTSKTKEQQKTVENLKARLRDMTVEGSGDSEDGESMLSLMCDARLKGICRECEYRRAAVVILPCKHLCLCEECNEEVAPVPCHICRCIRSGSVTVYLS